MLQGDATLCQTLASMQSSTNRLIIGQLFGSLCHGSKFGLQQTQHAEQTFDQYLLCKNSRLVKAPPVLPCPLSPVPFTRRRSRVFYKKSLLETLSLAPYIVALINFANWNY